MLNTFFVECRKLIFSISFLWGVLFVLALCMATSVYMDPGTGKSFTTFELLGNQHLQIRNNLCARDVIVMGLSNPYATLFLPISVGLGFVPQICTERKYCQIRLQIIRQGKKRYAIGKTLSAYFIGGLIVLAGYILYSSIVYAVFPHNVLAGSYQETLNTISFWRIICGKITEGISAAALSLFVCIWVSDQYLALCIPMLYQFLLLTAQSVTALTNPRVSRILYSFMLPCSAQIWVHFSWTALLNTLIIPLLTIVLFLTHVERKKDCGE